MGLRDRYLFKDYKCFFVTTTCYKHFHLLKSEAYFLILADSIIFLNHKYNAEILAYVLMPNHIHLIIYFKDANRLSDYMRDLKKYTSYKIRKNLENEGDLKLLNAIRFNNQKQKFKVWMDRFDDVFLESRNIVETKLDYIHLNPVKKDFCIDPAEYEYSSSSFYYEGTQNGFPIEVVHYKEYF